jgi:arylsulfatase A-like enzyme
MISRSLASTLAVLLAFSPLLEGADSPNFLFIVADDLATRLGCYGDKAAVTPHIDRLAKEGVLFERAYCQGVVCTPSRTSFMLGLSNAHAQARHFIQHPETMTMGRWMREHGYQTCAIGKLDHDDPEDRYTDPRAWDVRVKREEIKPLKKMPQFARLDEDLGLKREKISFIGVAEAPEAVQDWARAERMLEFFDRERDPKKPFFAAIGFHSPHGPWETTEECFGRQDPTRFTLEPTPPGATALPPGSLLHEPGFEMSEGRQREGQKGYYAAVTFLDQQIGRLMDFLKSRDLLENTIVVLTSDHGYHLGWRGQWCKHSLDEQVLRVPLIVRHPQGARGASAGGIVELIDLFPSFCEMARLPAPRTLDGKSFLHLVQNPAESGKRVAFCRGSNGRTARDSRWRLIERNDGARELYDHESDPSEYFSVAEKPENAGVLKGLHKLLEGEFGALPKTSSKGGANERKSGGD